MKRLPIDPLIASTQIANQRQNRRQKALARFNLVAFGFLLGIITGHLLFGR